MKLPSVNFHAQALNIISTSIRSAKKHGLKVNTMPPHLSIITSKPMGDQSLMLSCSFPEILQDVDPQFWSQIAKYQLSNQSDGVGFVFWCIVEDLGGIETLFGLSYQLGGEFNAFLSDFNLENLKPVEPFEVVPYLYDDYEQEMVVH